MNATVNINVKCSDCGEKLPSEWAHFENTNKCPKCGSISHTIEMGITEKMGVTLHENIKGKLKDPAFNSKRNPRYDFFEGDEVRKKDGKWMKKTRILDKYNNKYIEKVIDPDTGEVIHENEEPLSEHFGHGSAKFKNDKISQ